MTCVHAAIADLKWHKPHPRRKVKRHPSRLVAGTRFVQKSFLKVEKRLANPANSRSSVFPPLHASLQDQKNNDERDVICLLQVLFTAPVRGTISRPAALQGKFGFAEEEPSDKKKCKIMAKTEQACCDISAIGLRKV